MTLLEARRAAARRLADYCRNVQERIKQEAAVFSEPERAHLIRAFADLEREMRKRSR